MLKPKKRNKRDLPAAYLSGHQEFYGLDFLVNKHTLIPRPDTVVMVDEAIAEISNFKFLPTLRCCGRSPELASGLRSGSRACLGTISNQIQNPNAQKINRVLLIDIGTGTGCIPISIVKNLKKSVKVVAIDISRAALQVAKKNAKKHGVKINFLQDNLLSPLLSLKNKNLSMVIITANLPYLTKKWYDSEPSIQSEPRTALVGGGKNGLGLYEKLLKQINLLTANLPRRQTGCKLQTVALLEIDPRQTDEAKKLIQKYLPDFSVEIKKDLAGRDRVIKILRI